MNLTGKMGVLAGVLGGALMATLLPGAAVAAAEAARDVIVRNSDSQPIPTKAIGTSKVDATGSTVTVQGNPAGPAVPVQVTNLQQQAITRPFQENVYVRRGTLAVGENRAGRKEFETLAADERLTITHWAGSSDEVVTDVKLAAGCMSDFTILHAAIVPPAPGYRTGFSSPITFDVPPRACASIEVFWRDHLAAGEPDLSYSIFVSGYITKVG